MVRYRTFQLRNALSRLEAEHAAEKPRPRANPARRLRLSSADAAEAVVRSEGEMNAPRLELFRASNVWSQVRDVAPPEVVEGVNIEMNAMFSAIEKALGERQRRKREIVESRREELLGKWGAW